MWPLCCTVIPLRTLGLNFHLRTACIAAPLKTPEGFASITFALNTDPPSSTNNSITTTPSTLFNKAFLGYLGVILTKGINPPSPMYFPPPTKAPLVSIGILISGNLIGMKTNEDTVILLDDLLKETNIDFDKQMFGVYLPKDELLKRRNYEWFVRLNKVQIVAGNSNVSKLFSMSYSN